MSNWPISIVNKHLSKVYINYPQMKNNIKILTERLPSEELKKKIFNEYKNLLIEEFKDTIFTVNYEKCWPIACFIYDGDQPVLQSRDIGYFIKISKQRIKQFKDRNGPRWLIKNDKKIQWKFVGLINRDLIKI